MIQYQYTPFEDRDVQFPGKRFITRPDSSVELCTIARTSNGQAAEGVIYNPGTPIDAQSFNDQLNNIKNVFDSVGVDLAKKQATLNAGQNVTLTPQPDGTVTIDATGGGGGGSYTAGENIDITNDEISAKRTVDNILLGGSDLTRSVAGKNLFSDSTMIFSPGDGYQVNGQSELSTTALKYTALEETDFWTTETFTLYLKINVDGTIYQAAINNVSSAATLYMQTFTIGGVDFTIASISITSDALEVYDLLYDDSQDTHTCYLVACALECNSADITGLRLNNKDTQIERMIFNAAYYQEIGDLYDVALSNPSAGQALVYDGNVWRNRSVSQYTELTGVLHAGETGIGFIDAAITADSVIDIYADSYGVNVLYVSALVGSISIVFDAPAQDVNIKVRLS